MKKGNWDGILKRILFLCFRKRISMLVITYDFFVVVDKSTTIFTSFGSILKFV